MLWEGQGRTNYGSHKEISEGITAKVAKVEFTCRTDTQPAYHNETDYIDRFFGDITINASVPQHRVNLFGTKRYSDSTPQFKVSVSELPLELQEKMKALWLEIEEALVPKEEK